MLIWMIFLGIGVGLEGYAILTKERYFPTLSRTLWKLFRFEDRGFDRGEKIWRWAVTIIMSSVFAWGMLHIAWGPCAFGVC